MFILSTPNFNRLKAHLIRRGLSDRMTQPLRNNINMDAAKELKTAF